MAGYVGCDGSISWVCARAECEVPAGVSTSEWDNCEECVRAGGGGARNE